MSIHTMRITVLLVIVFLYVNGYLYAPRIFTGLQDKTLASVTPVLDSSKSPSSRTLYPVIKIVDGDTFVILKDNKRVKVRLIGIDTPEVIDPRHSVQCFGRKASQKSYEILNNVSVAIETDPSQGTHDKYGRLLAYMYLTDGTFFNEYMIAEGYAHEYTYNIPYKYQSAFKKAERSAREKHKGLWASDVCA